MPVRHRLRVEEPEGRIQRLDISQTIRTQHPSRFACRRA
jgi:hypothetical protein